MKVQTDHTTKPEDSMMHMILLYIIILYCIYILDNGMTAMANVSNLANHVDNSAPIGQSLLHATTAAFEQLFHHVHSAYRSVLHLLAPHN